MGSTGEVDVLELAAKFRVTKRKQNSNYILSDSIQSPQGTLQANGAVVDESMARPPSHL